MDGSYRRFPLGVRHVGKIGSSGESQLLHDTAEDSEWFARGDWLKKEGITSFAGHPLIFRDETLGVLGVFRRAFIDEQEYLWLRAFADHAAAAIANARAIRRNREAEEGVGARERILATGGQKRPRLWRHRRGELDTRKGARADRAGRSHGECGHDSRRIRNGKGADCSSHSRTKPASRTCDGESELRGDTARAVRERVLRACQRSLYRRGE